MRVQRGDYATCTFFACVLRVRRRRCRQEPRVQVCGRAVKNWRKSFATRIYLQSVSVCVCVYVQIAREHFLEKVDRGLMDVSGRSALVFAERLMCYLCAFCGSAKVKS